MRHIDTETFIAHARVLAHLRTGLDPAGFLAPLVEYFDGYTITPISDLVPDTPAALEEAQS